MRHVSSSIRLRLFLSAGLLLLAPLTLPAASQTADTDDSAEVAPVNEAQSQEPEVAAGHSHHGDAFNEGPRQQAYLMGGTGNVHFPATCHGEHAAKVQQFIDQGVGQLHGFWYYEAERSFRQAAMLDPDCAIAYWGMALANKNNEKRARGFIEEASKRKDLVSPRERMYIDAWASFLKQEEKKPKDAEKKRREALVKALEGIVVAHPDDIEAKAFLGLQLYDNRGKGIPIASYFAYDALLKDILEVNPRHPCHHYRIHLWDYERPEQALDSSALCGPAAPAIAHMWHMPGHIYSRLKRYHDAVWHQEASARVDHAHMMRDRVIPDQIHNFAHNNEWLIRNLIHVGRARDALDLAKNMIDLPQHPSYNTLAKRGSAHYGKLRLEQVLNEFELWDTVLALAETRYLPVPDKQEDQHERLRLIARAHFRSGSVEQGVRILEDLRAARENLEAERDEAVERARRILTNVGKSQDEIDAAGKKEAGKFKGRFDKLDRHIAELEGLEHLHHQRWSDALERFRKAGNLPDPLLATVELKAGETENAIKRINKHVSRNAGATLPLAHQIDILWQANRQEEAGKAFASLRKISCDIDLDTPPFQRLAPIAAALGFPPNWRMPLEPRDDIGERPDLDSLGPFRWQPSPAPDWELVDHLGERYSLASYRGRPVVVIFYLGWGCLHCAEQLAAFAPKTEEFRQAGIDLIAVSTDTPELLTQSHENYMDGEFPFPLVSDAPLEVFKKYRCFDDFEKQPLHGTFLIDSAGLVRWQDISYEPFMKPDFVLEEARRLLAQDSAAASTPAASAAASE